MFFQCFCLCFFNVKTMFFRCFLLLWKKIKIIDLCFSNVFLCVFNVLYKKHYFFPMFFQCFFFKTILKTLKKHRRNMIFFAKTLNLHRPCFLSVFPNVFSMFFHVFLMIFNCFFHKIYWKNIEKTLKIHRKTLKKHR